MSIFGKILAKLGLGDSRKETPATKPTGSSPAPTPTPNAAPRASTPQPMSQVDVVAKLEGMAKSNPEKLNWKTSIVDLMKLLGLDSSFNARKELATELHAPADKMSDSAQMNMWLHKTVLQKLAENGGNIPADLLH